MLKRFPCATVVLCAVLLGAGGRAEPPDRNWEFLWGDEFEGSALDVSKWSWGALPWGGVYHKTEYASYITPEDSYLAGGSLWLRCRKVGRTIDGAWVPWTEGLVHSNGKFRITYGYAEIRAQFATHRGTWPAFWTLSDGWPPEIDIAELFGGEYYMHHGLCTGPDWQSAAWDSNHSTADGAWNWHFWGLEWGPGFLRWWKDGAVVKTVTGLKVPDQSMYFILNSGMRWGFDGTTPDPNTTRIDYIRVYRRTETVLNGGFEQTSSFSGGRSLPWEKVGNAAPHAGSGRNGSVSSRLTAASVSAAVEQMVYGLLPNTPYVVTGWGRSDPAWPNAIIRIGVKNHGGPETAVPVSGTNWRQAVTSFTTGAAHDSARVYANLPQLNNVGYADDLELRRAGVINDPSFERREAAPWFLTEHAFVHDWGGGYCRSGRFGLRLNQHATAGRSVEQTVYGLRPDATYRLTCWLRTHNQAVRLGAKDHGRLESNSTRTGVNWSWSRHTHTFTLGSTNTSARIYAWIPPGSNNQVVDLDDFLLVEPLPPPWTAQDIGVNAVAGESGQMGSRLLIRAGGENVSNAADSLHFVRQAFPGDGTFTARLASFEASDLRAKAGVMIRAGTAANAAHAMVHWLPEGQVEFIWRTNSGAVASYVWASHAVPWPPHLRLARTNNVITAFFSTDGSAWRQVGAPQTVNLPTTAVAGLAVCAHAPKDAVDAVFTSATLSVADSDLDGLPDAWELARFGNLTTANAASDFDGDGFTDAQEWSCGLDPTVVDQLEFTDVTVSGGGSVLLVGFYGVPAVDYTLETTTLASAAGWTEVIEVGRATDPGDGRGGLIRHRYAVPIPPGSAALFVRINVRR